MNDDLPTKKTSQDNHGSSAEERRPEGVVLRLVSRRARGERVARRASVGIDDSAADRAIATAGAAQSDTSSLAQRPQNHSGKYV